MRAARLRGGGGGGQVDAPEVAPVLQALRRGLRLHRHLAGAPRDAESRALLSTPVEWRVAVLDRGARLADQRLQLGGTQGRAGVRTRRRSRLDVARQANREPAPV